MLANLDEDLESLMESVFATTPDELAEQFIMVDRLVLAQGASQEDDALWLAQTLELLEELNEETEANPVDEADDYDGMLEELEWFDGFDSTSS